MGAACASKSHDHGDANSDAEDMFLAVEAALHPEEEILAAELVSDGHAFEISSTVESAFAGSDAGAATDEGLHRNDLRLPATLDGSVSWDKLLATSDVQDFRALQENGSFACASCSLDVSKIPGNYGYLYVTYGNDLWEEKHMLSIWRDIPSSLKCLRCHLHKKGWCARYRATGDASEGGTRLPVTVASHVAGDAAQGRTVVVHTAGGQTILGPREWSPGLTVSELQEEVLSSEYARGVGAHSVLLVRAGRDLGSSETIASTTGEKIVTLTCIFRKAVHIDSPMMVSDEGPYAWKIKVDPLNHPNAAAEKAWLLAAKPGGGARRFSKPSSRTGRRVDPHLGGREVTYIEMVRDHAALGRTPPAAKVWGSQAYWESLKVSCHDKVTTVTSNNLLKTITSFAKCIPDDEDWRKLQLLLQDAGDAQYVTADIAEPNPQEQEPDYPLPFGFRAIAAGHAISLEGIITEDPFVYQFRQKLVSDFLPDLR